MTPEHNFAPPSILDNLDPKTCVEIARRRKWWIVLSVIALFVGTAVFAHRLPNIYRAETVILVDSQQVPDKYVAVITTGDIAGRLSTLQEQVLSPTRLKTLIESEGLYPDPDWEIDRKRDHSAGSEGDYRRSDHACSGKNRVIPNCLQQQRSNHSGAYHQSTLADVH